MVSARTRCVMASPSGVAACLSDPTAPRALDASRVPLLSPTRPGDSHPATSVIGRARGGRRRASRACPRPRDPLALRVRGAPPGVVPVPGIVPVPRHGRQPVRDLCAVVATVSLASILPRDDRLESHERVIRRGGQRDHAESYRLKLLPAIRPRLAHDLAAVHLKDVADQKPSRLCVRLNLGCRSGGAAHLSGQLNRSMNCLRRTRLTLRNPHIQESASVKLAGDPGSTDATSGESRNLTTNDAPSTRNKKPSTPRAHALPSLCCIPTYRLNKSLASVETPASAASAQATGRFKTREEYERWKASQARSHY